MMLTDAQWAVLGPLVEACRPRANGPPRHLRRTIGAILWRHTNGAKWRSLPAEFGPWWMAAQTFIRWSRLGVWEHLLSLVQERGAQLGMAFLDGTSVRAFRKFNNEVFWVLPITTKVKLGKFYFSYQSDASGFFYHSFTDALIRCKTSLA